MMVEVVTRKEQLEPLASRWDELASQDRRDGFFRTFIWYKSWLQHIRPDAEPFVVVARGADGSIVGLAPLCRLRYRDLGFRLTSVAWAGRETVSGDFLDIVADEAARSDAWRAILSSLWDTRDRWTMLVMGELLDGGESLAVLEEFAHQRQLMTRRQEQRICPYISLPPAFDEYLNGLGSSTRYHIRRRLRDSEKGGLRVETYSRPADVADRFPTLVRLHLARWKKDNLPGTFGRPGFVQCLHDVFLNPPNGARYHLYELQRDGDTLASLLTFHYGDSALYYQAGWDPAADVSAFSPGVVLMAHSIRHAIASGLRYYEFLRGDEQYKSRWTKTYRKTVSFLLARRQAGKSYLHVAQLKDFVKSHISSSKAPTGLTEQCAE